MRSQMAEVFYNHATDSNDAMSAGAIAETKDHISKRATQAMDEVCLETRHLSPLQVTSDMVDLVDKVIYFPSEYMPDYVKNSQKSEFWDVADPHYNQEKGMEFVREVRDDIKRRVDKLIDNKK